LLRTESENLFQPFMLCEMKSSMCTAAYTFEYMGVASDAEEDRQMALIELKCHTVLIVQI